MTLTIDQNANRNAYSLRIFAEKPVRRAIDELSDCSCGSSLFSRVGSGSANVGYCRNGRQRENRRDNHFFHTHVSPQCVLISAVLDRGKVNRR
jgi:hypothetical protein